MYHLNIYNELEISNVSLLKIVYLGAFIRVLIIYMYTQKLNCALGAQRLIRRWVLYSRRYRKQISNH